MTEESQTVVLMYDLVALARRISKAPAAQEEMTIHAAWMFIYPGETIRCVGKDEDGLKYEISPRYTEYWRFTIDGKFLAAACVLLPPGWTFAVLPAESFEAVAVDPSGTPRYWARGATEALCVASLACLAHAAIRTGEQAIDGGNAVA